MNNVSKIFNNNLLKISSIVLIASTIVNFSNYLFNLIMARVLSAEEFGIVATIISLSVILTVPSSTMINVMAKYVALYHAKNQNSLIKNLFNSSLKLNLYAGLVALISFWIMTPFLSSFFKINPIPLLLFSLFLPLSLLSALNTGTLQGLKKFFSISIINILVALLKLIFAISLVLLGFSINGVMIGLVLSILIGYFYSYYKIRTLISPNTTAEGSSKKSIKTPTLTEKLFQVSNIFFATLFLALLTNIDLSLAKHYLSPYQAGQYAALSVTGKIISYASLSLNNILLPLVVTAFAVEDQAQQQKILKQSLLLVSLISLTTLFIFTTFPKFVVTLLFGTKYLEIVPNLPLYSLAIFFSTLSTVLIYYFMAISNKPYLLLLIAATIIQVILILLFHQNIFQLTRTVLATSTLLFFGLTINYFITTKTKAIHKI